LKDLLKIDAEHFSVQEIVHNGLKMKCRAYENLLYVSRPVDEDHQKINIYIPEYYYEDGEINGYRRDSAPIFLITTVGGYMPGWALTLTEEHWMQETAVAALMRGYIVACPASRGRGLKDADRNNIGAAPAGIVDLKAAIAFLRHNKDVIPGNMERIIPNGGSAGGAMCALLGATGNHADYDPYLEEIGAAKERNDVYAASCYCPITDLEHADEAYEWLYANLHDYMKFPPPPKDAPLAAPNAEPAKNFKPPKPVCTVLTEEEIALSDQLRKQFIDYVNGLGLYDGNRKLELDETGAGSFFEYMKAQIIRSAQSAIDRGEALADYDWLTVQNEKVTDINVDSYLRYITRLKGVPAFDDLEYNNPENELFADRTGFGRHFTSFGAANNKAGENNLAQEQQIKMMNPLYYIEEKDRNNHQIATYWRIRHGASDRDTSFAIPLILQLVLKNKGYHVDFFFPWGQGHGSDYDRDELFSWIDEVSRR
jgi:hypothetical protein